AVQAVDILDEDRGTELAWLGSPKAEGRNRKGGARIIWDTADQVSGYGVFRPEVGRCQGNFRGVCGSLLHLLCSVKSMNLDCSRSPGLPVSDFGFRISHLPNQPLHPKRPALSGRFAYWELFPLNFVPHGDSLSFKHLSPPAQFLRQGFVNGPLTFFVRIIPQ